MNHFLQLREQEAEVLRELNPRESLNSSISQSCLISVELSETFLSTWGFDSPLVDMPSVFYFIFFLSFFLFFFTKPGAPYCRYPFGGSDNHASFVEMVQYSVSID